jgi:hypothetical protein
VTPQETQVPAAVAVAEVQQETLQLVVEKTTEVPQVIVEQEATPIVQEPAANKL